MFSPRGDFSLPWDLHQGTMTHELPCSYPQILDQRTGLQVHYCTSTWSGYSGPADLEDDNVSTRAPCACGWSCGVVVWWVSSRRHSCIVPIGYFFLVGLSRLATLFYCSIPVQGSQDIRNKGNLSRTSPDYNDYLSTWVGHSTYETWEKNLSTIYFSRPHWPSLTGS
jgi:hypothetical protein